jgi:hypothetical protein
VEVELFYLIGYYAPFGVAFRSHPFLFQKGKGQFTPFNEPPPREKERLL